MNRDSDINAFRPSYLRASDIDGDSESFQFSPIQTGEPPTSPIVSVEGSVSLSTSIEPELMMEKHLDHDDRWQLFDKSEYTDSPVLFIVLNFKMIQKI